MADLPPAPPVQRAGTPLVASLWTHLRLAEGLELHFDATRFNATAEQLLAVRQAIRSAFFDDNSASR